MELVLAGLAVGHRPAEERHKQAEGHRKQAEVHTQVADVASWVLVDSQVHRNYQVAVHKAARHRQVAAHSQSGMGGHNQEAEQQLEEDRNQAAAVFLATCYDYNHARIEN